eukprot:3432210-Pleurochrysis_carterae.AAC.3
MPGVPVRSSTPLAPATTPVRPHNLRVVAARSDSLCARFVCVDAGALCEVHRRNSEHRKRDHLGGRLPRCVNSARSECTLQSTHNFAALASADMPFQAPSECLCQISVIRQ